MGAFTFIISPVFNSIINSVVSEYVGNGALPAMVKNIFWSFVRYAFDTCLYSINTMLALNSGLSDVTETSHGANKYYLSAAKDKVFSQILWKSGDKIVAITNEEGNVLRTDILESLLAKLQPDNPN